MDKIELQIVALSHSVTQSHNYAVVLGELEGSRRLPVVIGGFEAQAIAVAMEKMLPNRPLTHDLFKSTLESFHIDLREIVISNLLDGIFYAKLVCVQNGTTYEIDSRTSDALAMAVRFECPIYTYDSILEEAGVSVEDNDSSTANVKVKKSPKADSIEYMTEDALQQLLDKVLAEEDYEKAARIRDEINKRKSQNR